jgi:hypothetical protein
MDAIGPGSLVIVHCANPREKMWGVLLKLDSSGAVVRGMDLNTVEDWLHQERTDEPALIGPSTFFVPVHRVVRIDLDESGGVVESYGDRYTSACGGDARVALTGLISTEDQS